MLRGAMKSLLIFFVCCLLVSSWALDLRLSQTSGEAKEGQSLTLTCDVINGSLVGNLVFSRPVNNTMVALCNVNSCEPQIIGYSAKRISATSFSVTINSLNSTNDVGQWSCSCSDATATTTVATDESNSATRAQITSVTYLITMAIAAIFAGL